MNAFTINRRAVMLSAVVGASSMLVPRAGGFGGGANAQAISP